MKYFAENNRLDDYEGQFFMHLATARRWVSSPERLSGKFTIYKLVKVK